MMAETILQEAIRLADGEREAEYGDAYADAARWAEMLSTLTGLSVKPEHFPLAMICVKLSRVSQSPECWHRDSYADIAGYARVAEKMRIQRSGARRLRWRLGWPSWRLRGDR